MNNKQIVLILLAILFLSVVVFSVFKQKEVGNFLNSQTYQQRNIDGIDILEASDFTQDERGQYQLHVKSNKDLGLTPSLVQLVDKSTNTVARELGLTRSENQLTCEGDILDFDVTFDKYETSWFSDDVSESMEYDSKLAEKYNVNVIFDETYYDEYQISGMCYQFVDTQVSESPPEGEEEIIFGE